MNAEDVTDEQGNILIPARTVIERNITEEEQVKILEERNSLMQMALDDIILNGGGF